MSVKDEISDYIAGITVLRETYKENPNKNALIEYFDDIEEFYDSIIANISIQGFEKNISFMNSVDRIHILMPDDSIVEFIKV